MFLKITSKLKLNNIKICCTVRGTIKNLVQSLILSILYYIYPQLLHLHSDLQAWQELRLPKILFLVVFLVMFFVVFPVIFPIVFPVDGGFKMTLNLADQSNAVIFSMGRTMS